MKLTTASIIIAAAIGLHINGIAGASIVNRHVKSMTATHLFPEAHYGIEVDASEKSWGEVEKVATRRKDRFIGRAWLGNTLLREMREFAGVDSPDLSSGDALHKIKMTHLVTTTPLHTDVIVGGGDRTYEGSSLQVGFYVLNDNPHAYFETNEGKLCIPIVKGSFITFDGRRPHRTVIADGSVDLLGPFDLQSMKCVAATLAIKSTYEDHGEVKTVVGRRQLGEETDPEMSISGSVFRGIKLDDNMEIF
jgi:hypothetical protein